MKERANASPRKSCCAWARYLADPLRSNGKQEGAASPLRSGWLFLCLALLVWTAARAASAWTSWRGIYRDVVQIARFQAIAEWQKDLLYRRWNSEHSPVYVPVTPDTPPNPSLEGVPERDVTTPSGRRLTLMNPSYMARQVHKMGNAEHLYSHITALRTVRAENTPDAWERDALLRLQAGAAEHSSVEIQGGEPHLRFMRPLVTETACLRCHAAQGYRVGDVRGGVSVAVPLGPLFAVMESHRRATVLGHLTIWLVGLVALLLGGRAHLGHVRNRLALEEEKLALEYRLSEARRLEAVGTLAGGIAHQFNNLLMMVGGYAELARDHHLGERRLVQNMDRILVVCGRAATLVEKMSLLARRENFFPGEAPVRETLERVFAPLRGQLSPQTELREEVPPGAVVAMAPSQLETVLRNLLSNAADAVSQAGGEITVKAEPCVLLPEEPEGPAQDLAVEPGVRIVVEDNGTGIEPEILPRVFEPFFTTKDVGRGDGLGLSVARAIVQRHGGRIGIHAGPNRGTSVEICLRAA